MSNYKNSGMISVELSYASGPTLTLPSTDGVVSVSGWQPDGKETAIMMNVGVQKGRLHTDDVVPTLSITAHHYGQFATSSNLVQFLERTGDWAGATTRDPEGEVAACQVVVKLTDASANVDTITAPNARITSGYDVAMEGATHSLEFSCLRDSSGNDQVQFS